MKSDNIEILLFVFVVLWLVSSLLSKQRRLFLDVGSFWQTNGWCCLPSRMIGHFQVIFISSAH